MATAAPTAVTITSADVILPASEKMLWRASSYAARPQRTTQMSEKPCCSSKRVKMH